MEILWLPFILALGYVALCGYTYLMQDNLLYYPDPVRPSSTQLQSVELQLWQPNNSSFRGYVSSGEKNGKAGLVVVFHGNAGSAWHRSYYVQFLETLGYRVVLAEYPGYGGRPGKLGEKSFVQDARETVRLAYGEFGGPIYLCGESLGAGVLAGVAAEPPEKINGIILITPWDTLPNLAQRFYWYLPVRWLARDRYDNIQNLAGFHGRIAMVLAERDEIVPTAHGMTLFDSLKGAKKRWALKGASHNTWTYFLNDGVWKEIVEFINPETLEKDSK
jgi:uncharacterized protein